MLESAERTVGALRTAMEEGRARLISALLAGETAEAACSELSTTCDELVLSMLEGADLDHVALVATGGWGRREMCPRSDLDLLILVSDIDGPVPLADSILYPMWDAGIKVGHAVREPLAMEELARNDVKTATALLDARLLAGSSVLFAQLVGARDRAIAPGGAPTRFVKQLIDERDRRHRRFGDSIYLLEPNIKQGIGALRDLTTARWVAQVRFGLVAGSELVRSGKLTQRQADVLEASRDFFLRVRSLLQQHTGRASDQLTFEVQEAIGPVLYPNARPLAHQPAVAPAVEALMRDYYLHASDVTQVMAQLFEAALTTRQRRPSVARIDGSFVLFTGKLSVATAGVFDKRPSEMVRVFRIARELGVPIHWHTRELVAQRAVSADDPIDLTHDSRACELFCEALVDVEDTRTPSLLEEMHRVGLLDAMIPEFAACRGRVQHDLYHVYTVDQHQLNAVNMLKRIARGEIDELAAVTHVFRELGDTHVVFLATLLHDVGKPLGKGHSESGATITQRAARRLGFAADDVERAAKLVRQHLAMSHVSQRRDLADPEVIRRFADRVGDLSTLRELFLLTICDTAMTAPGNLSPWKLQLLVELYERTRALFVGDGDRASPDVSELTARTRERTAALLADAGVADAEALAAELEAHVVSALSHRQLYRLLSLVPEVEAGERFAANLRAFPLKGHSEVAIVAGDRSGLLSEVTGAMAVAGISVEGAVIGSIHRPDRVLASDLFFVRGAEGEALSPGDPRWQRFREELDTLLGHSDAGAQRRLEKRLDRRRQDPFGPRVTPEVLTEVKFADDGSDRYAILEVFTQDRVGLLSEIADCLAEQGVDIDLAKISTEGGRAADSFYVVAVDTRLPLDDAHRARVVAALEELLR